MSDDSLMFDGRKYLSSKRSAELFGYSTDYVGELCRQGKVVCFRKGRQWYVEEKSLFAYLEGAREKTAERKHELSRHFSRQLNKKTSPGFWRSLDVSRTLVSRIGAFFVSRRLVRASLGSLLVFALFFAQTPVARAGLEDFSLASILRISRSVTQELAHSFRETAAKTGGTLAVLAEKPASLLEGVSVSARSATAAVQRGIEGVVGSVTAVVAESSAGVQAVAKDLAAFPAHLAASVSLAAADSREAVGAAQASVTSRLTEVVSQVQGSLRGLSQSTVSAVATTREVVRKNLLAAIQYEDTFNLITSSIKDRFDSAIDKVADTLNRAASSTLGISPNGSESASGGGATSVPQSSTTPIAPIVPVAPSGTGKTVTERIIERIVRVETPIIQNISQTTPGITVSGGVSSAALELRLQQVGNELRAEISRVSSQTAVQTSQVFQVIGHATRIDQLSGTVITSPSVSGGTWSGASLTGTTNISSASISALTIGEATTTASNGFNISAGCFAVNGVCVGSGGSGDVGSGTAGLFPFYNGTGTALTATSSIYLTQGGNIGIGTTSPNSRLAVNGNMEVTGTSSVANLTATGTVTFLSGLAATSGGTGQTTFTTGDILYASGANTLSKLAVGSNGQVLKLSGGVPSWAADLQGGGGGGGGLFATSTDDLVIYPVDTTDVFVLGNNATTTTGTIFEVTGNTRLIGELLVTGSTTLANLMATNVTSTNATTTSSFATTASSTNLFTSNFTLGRVSGFLKATAGAVATALVDLATDVTGILPVANGGSGWGAFQANTVLIGNGTGAIATTTEGTNGQVLALVGGVPTWQSTTTLSTISGSLNVSSQVTGTLAAGNGGTGISSYTAGDITYASGPTTLARVASSTNGFVLALANGIPSWVASTTLATISGTLNVASQVAGILSTPNGGTGWGAFQANSILIGNGTGAIATTTEGTNGQVLTLVGGIPTWQSTTTLANISGTLGVTSGGTGLTTVTTGDTFYGSGTNVISKLAASTNGFVLAMANGIPAWVASTTLSTISGTLNLASQVAGVLTTSNGGTGWANLQANSIVLGNGTGAVATTSAGTNGQVLTLVSGVPTWVSTTTLANISGTLGVTSGGTGLTTLTTGDTLYASGANTFAKLAAGTNGFVLAMANGIPSWVASTTLSTISGVLNLATQITGTLGVSNGGTGAATFGQGWIYSDGGTGALAASTSPTVNYLVSTSTTATSTFAAGIRTTALDVTGATSTFANGIQLASGCFRGPDGSCVGGSSGGGSGTVNSGTQGQLAYFGANGTAVSGTSQLFLSTGNLFGIGSTTPWAKLAVNPVAGDTNQFVVGSSTATSFLIDNAGKVGIGLTSLFGKFNINSSGIPAVSGSITSGLVISNGLTGTAANLGTYDSGSTATSYSYLKSTYVNSAGTALALVLQPTGGNVGIGSTTPLAKFGVHANNGDTNTLLFNIASSTASATTSLFSISNGGVITSTASATSTFSSGLQTTALNVTGATSTFANGIQLAAGCYRLPDGSCAGASAGLTGTTGQVAYFSGTDTAVGTSSLFISTTGAVGVGTTTLTASGLSPDLLVFGRSGRGTIAVDSILTPGAGTVAGDLLFQSSNNSVTGNASALVRLRTTFAGSGGASGYGGSLALGVKSDNSTSFTTYQFAQEGLGVGSTTPWARLAVNPVAGDTNQFVVGSSTATSFIIDNAGKVGIGTTSPSGVLTVSASTSLSTFFSSSTPIVNSMGTKRSIVNYESYSLTDTTYVQTPKYIAVSNDFASTVTAANYGFIVDMFTPSTNTTAIGSLRGGLFQSIHNGTGALTAAIALNGTSVNTGNATATTLLGVLGSATNGVSGGLQSATTTTAEGVRANVINFGVNSLITSAYGVRVSNVTNTGTITNTYGVHVGDMTTGTQTNTPYSFYASDTGAYNFFASSTAIGSGLALGNGTPGALLHLYSGQTYGNTIRLGQNSNSEYADIDYNRSGATTLNIRNAYDASGSLFNLGIGNKSALSLYLAESAGIARVGIGTTTPTVNFEVSGAQAPSLRLRPYLAESPDASGYYATLNSKYDDEAFSLDVGGNKIISTLGYTNATQLLLYTGNTERLRINSSGNVGIGSTTPWAKLAINPVAGDTNQFVVGSSTATSFIINPAGKVGLGLTAPATRLDVFEANAAPQLRLTKSASLYSELTVDSTGDLTMSAAGGDIYAVTENLWICDGGSCPSLTATSTAGNIFVENAVTFGNGFSFRQISVNELGLYNASSSLLMIFDQGQ